MIYQLIVKPEAEADIEESFIWYEDQVSGLGHDFRLELGRTIARIKAAPLGFPIVYKWIRRTLVNRFPHAIFFFVDDDKIFVAACVHHKRHPRIWQRRR